MNEKGLGANMLYLAQTDLGPAPKDDKKPRISWMAWLQYILSNYATVAEAVEAMKDDPVYFVPCNFGPGGNGHPTVYLSLSNPTGDSAIMEYIKGKVVIHHGRKHQVMINSPTYDKQLTLNNYWEKIDGSKTLSGSHQSEDRFVRASYYLKRLSTEEKDASKSPVCSASCGTCRLLGEHPIPIIRTSRQPTGGPLWSHSQGLLLRVVTQPFRRRGEPEQDRLRTEIGHPQRRP